MTGPAVQPESPGPPGDPFSGRADHTDKERIRTMKLAIFRGRGSLRHALLRRALLPAVVIGGVMLAAGCGSHPPHTAAYSSSRRRREDPI
jgi:hypothetical protein